ncbi:hypothetical protein [Spiroplasma clarkii]|uniref:hypothetical protein n=1 Tax=Spiroplasma clarkii TaxID=2139 RepID=UPI00164A07DC|nr:hypothetical protein [Spiroplasma clarkii]
MLENYSVTERFNVIILITKQKLIFLSALAFGFLVGKELVVNIDYFLSKKISDKHYQKLVTTSKLILKFVFIAGLVPSLIYFWSINLNSIVNHQLYETVVSIDLLQAKINNIVDLMTLRANLLYLSFTSLILVLIAGFVSYLINLLSLKYAQELRRQKLEPIVVAASFEKNETEQELSANQSDYFGFEVSTCWFLKIILKIAHNKTNNLRNYKKGCSLKLFLFNYKTK